FKSHIDPLPVFFIRTVSLTNGNTAVVVHVPADQDAPFVTVDGRVYRRAADSSDPIHETDRHALDRLYERTAKARSRFAAFATDERTFARGESNQSWVRIFLSPYPYGVVNRSEITSPSEMVKLIAGTRSERALLRFEETSNASVTGSLPLESAYPTPDSVVLQPRSTVTYNGLAVEL